MIYFLDNSLQLQKIVTSKNVISAIHEHELNGLIRADVELDLSYANKFLVLGIDHVGYYYKDEFYLHKIQRVEYDHVNESAKVVLRHIFFEDMIFGKLIQDVRPQNQDALTVSRQTIDANTRWQTIMTDVTGRLSTNFYWQVPYEVIEFMTENYRIEYLPKTLFDGQKINGFQLHLANKIGEDKNIRIPYGSRVLDLKYEEDYSEIITKLVVHGKGEEVGSGYGRRINISDVNFSRNGVESPVGSLYLEDESITNTYGNDGQTPREGRVVFEDIEDANELAEAGYQHYLQVSRPQMLFTADVADIGDVGIGDSVMIIRREYDVYFNARIHKLSVDLLYPEDAQVELGDYDHFKESKIARKTREKNNRVQGQLSDRITRLKLEADERFDNEVAQWKSEYDQALIDVHAEIEADRENMTNLIEGTRTEFTDNLNAEITQTKEYAEQQSQAKAEEVRTDLGVVTSGHQAMIDNLQDNVMSIDDFIGDKTVGLNELLYNERMLFEEKLNNVDTWHYNILRGTRFDESFWQGSNMDVASDGLLNYFEFVPSRNTSNVPYIQSNQEVVFNAGETYTLSFDFQTFSVSREVNYIFIIASVDDGGSNMNIWHPNLIEDGTHLNTYYGEEFQRYWVRFKPVRTIRGFVRIGLNMEGETRRGFKLALPYLTQTDNTRWLYNQLDNTQNIEEISRRINQLEDGREEFITRTQYDFETGEINGTIKSVLETVDESLIIIQNHEDWVLTNGASIERTVDGFESKAWLTDIHNPNMIPFSAVENSDAFKNWYTVNAVTTRVESGFRELRDTPNSLIRTNSPPLSIVAGETYTLSFEAVPDSGYNVVNSMNYTWIAFPDGTNQRINGGIISENTGESFYGLPIKKFTVTFVANESADNAEVMIGSGKINPGSDGRLFFRKPKLEVGTVATPYHNAFSNLSQRADELSLAVQGIDTIGFLSQSDIQIVPDYVQIGSQRLDGSNIGSLLRVSPTGIDMVAEAMRLSGDLYVEGDITALAVNAIEGNFARLFANQLTADVITSDHIQVGTALVDKMFATRARIDELITKTHFVNEMHALTLNVVDLNASEIRTRLLTANTIEAEWLKGGTALIDKVFASTAMFERMMAKSGFVTTLNTVTIDTDQITIRRPDGGMLINNGKANWDFDVQMEEFIETTGVEWNGQWYETKRSEPTRVKIGSFKHSGRQLKLNIMIRLSGSSPAASELMFVRVRSFGGSLDYNVRRQYQVYRGSSQSHEFHVNLGTPQYEASMFYLEFQRDSSGTNSENIVQVRCNRAWQDG